MIPIPAGLVPLVVGDAMPTTSVGPLTRTDFVRYAGAGGDLNPIHHDEEIAREAGLPSVFAMGMLHAGILGARLARWVGPENLRGYSVRFVGQVWPGDVLAFTGCVDAVDVRGDQALARISLLVARRSGEEVLRAQAIAEVAEPPERTP